MKIKPLTHAMLSVLFYREENLTDEHGAPNWQCNVLEEMTAHLLQQHLAWQQMADGDRYQALVAGKALHMLANEAVIGAFRIGMQSEDERGGYVKPLFRADQLTAKAVRGAAAIKTWHAPIHDPVHHRRLCEILSKLAVDLIRDQEKTFDDWAAQMMASLIMAYHAGRLTQTTELKQLIDFATLDQRQRVRKDTSGSVAVTQMALLQEAYELASSPGASEDSLPRIADLIARAIER